MLTSIIGLGSLVAPFPSYVKISGKEITNIQACNALVKSIIMYFAYFGIYYSIRTKFRETFPIVFWLC